MKKIFFYFSLLITTSILFASCGNKIKVSPEMADFNSIIKGSHEDVSKAVEKYAADEKLFDNDIVYFGLSNPKVSKVEGDCYTVKFEAGITYRTYEICWEQNKIVSIEER